jgi:hypothetical protein
MLVTIKKLDGRKENIQVDEKQTVGALKESLSEKAGLDVSQVRLIFSGKAMNDQQVTNFIYTCFKCY